MSLPIDVYLFALLPALLWGISPTFTKRGIVNGGTAFQAALIVVVVGVACYLVGLFSMGEPGRLFTLSPMTIGLFALSGGAGAGAWLASFTGIDRVGASINSAGFNTHPLFATIGALVVLGEPLSIQTLLGIVVVVTGLTVVATSKGGDRRGWNLRDLAFPLFAAGAYAFSNVIRRFALTTTQATTVEAITINALATLGVLLVYAGVTTETAIRPPAVATRNFVVSGFLSAIALFFLFEAFARGSVAIVSALSGLSPVVAVIVAAVALSDVERVTRSVVGGACLVVCGVTLITLG